MQTSGSGGQVVLTNDTITANAASGPPAATGGNLQLNVGVQLRNTILSAGAAMAGRENCSAAGTSLGHNLEDTTPSQCGLRGSLGDQFGTNPLLGPLAANGGLTQTIAPLAISPAIDALQGNGCPATDQRGVARPQGAACDVGAYETAPGAAVTGQASAVSATSATLDGSATNPDAAAGTASFEYGLTTAYGLSSAAQPVAAGTSAGPFAASIGGLVPATTYHFRAVASNGAGAAFGADQTFVTTTAPPVTTPSTPTPPPAVPVLSGLSFSPTKFRAAASASTTAKKGVGSTVRYKLSMAAKVKFFVERATKGRRVGSTCAKATRSNKKKKACTRYVTVAGSLTRQGTTKPNKFRFTGRFGGHKLKPGKYRLRAVATSPAGKSSTPKRTVFRIVRR
jgi:hypothetical protein